MKFLQFKIKNYKGIEDITFDLNKSPEANIFTLVGLNESGKTTILEAINHFNNYDDGFYALNESKTVKNENSFIPITRRDNFNDTISIIVTLALEEGDLEKINEFVNQNTQFSQIIKKDSLVYYRFYNYKDSQFVELSKRWTGFDALLKSNGSRVHIDDKNYPKDNTSVATFTRTLIPSIIYFPNFLFDFPTRIYLESKVDLSSKELFYQDLIQDILNSLQNDTNVKRHLIDRIHDTSQRKNLDRLIQLMEKKVTDVIFEAWNRIFKRQIKDTRIVIKYNVDGENLSFLQFEIESEDGIYELHERSLGFKWFFIFLLFTQFRPFRKDKPQNIIFLFDEPASNLHSTAQKQILKSFENLTNNSKVIYTTHSHHLINPNWLESTYVVKNEGLILENPETYNIKQTKITIESYREFAANHPHNTAYFQPILDVLDYTPSNLETLPNCVFFEGKNDFYTLAYFDQIILENKYLLNMAPSTGSGNLDTLISLYIGWGKEFIILLDSDKAGSAQKQRYLDRFGFIVEKRIYTLEDIDPNWKKKEIESLFDTTEAVAFQQQSYPSSADFNKTQFNRSVQEHLINKKAFTFLPTTIDNFDKTLYFLRQKLDALG